MGKLTDDMTRLVSEVQTMRDDRINFLTGVCENTKDLLKGLQDADRQRTNEIRESLASVRNDMDGAHEAFFGKQTSRKK